MMFLSLDTIWRLIIPNVILAFLTGTGMQFSWSFSALNNVNFCVYFLNQDLVQNQDLSTVPRFLTSLGPATVGTKTNDIVFFL